MAIWIAILHAGLRLSTTLAAARAETDLDKLTARLVEVVEETMQPESVTLWLKDFNAKPVLSEAEGTPSGKDAKE